MGALPQEKILKILFLYPRYPETFWSFGHALKFISKKAAFPPLGLLTVAALLPSEWDKKLVDLNTGNLKDKDIAWADYVFVSAMDIQQASAREVISRCVQLETKVVAGGPLFTTSNEEFEGVDHLVRGEFEALAPQFVADMENGCLQRVYESERKPDTRHSPVPAWGLINIKKYASLSVQYSRGCPFDCEFCDVVLLNGRVPRTKSTEQLLNEMEAIYRLGWRDSVFIVDDNFIGNKKKLKTEVLPAIIEWKRQRNHPFVLNTQISIGISDDTQLMQLMVKAGFGKVFVGIETPNEESLVECGKSQNTDRDLIAAVKRIQNHGMEVQAGFIVGFDSDPQNIFERQIRFIQQSGIVTAMVGLLNAPAGTKLYKRLKGENRLLHDISGDNTDFSINFIPKMNREKLIDGYKHIMTAIYAPKQYYARIGTLLKEHRPQAVHKCSHLNTREVQALLKSVWYLGIRGKGQRYYWRVVISTLFRKPRSLPMVITLAIYGYHFRKLVERYAQNPSAVNAPL